MLRGSFLRICTQRNLVACRRQYSSSRTPSDLAATLPASVDYPNPRWFSDLQSRIKSSMTPELPKAKFEEAERLLKHTEKHWLGLLAGREGFITDYDYRGLDRQPIFWGDMARHVNNVMYNRYAESARVNFFRNHGKDAAEGRGQLWDDLLTPRGLGLILKSIKTEFKFPMTFPDNVTVLNRLVEAPTTETHDLMLEVWIISEKHRRLAARCLEEVTVYDYQAGRKATLAPFMVEKLNETWDLQEKFRARFNEEAKSVAEALDMINGSK
ncbi:unnamed protein product [Clonostachys chloroleuca]|uniref:Uncharacterized protein n=1 Tax=Clonostachys chloroleuca TaxID=1926264 RepID=A0AA35M5H0_9HYPO|nr:unnamed protein product [Clonostachys chloroleuca]